VPQIQLFDEKTRGRQSHDRVTLTTDSMPENYVEAMYTLLKKKKDGTSAACFDKDLLP
jgi:hypothetical protein